MNSDFSDFIRFFPIFRLFPTFRLLDSTGLIAIDPVVQRQGEPRLMPGQPAIGPSRPCLLLAEVQCPSE